MKSHKVRSVVTAILLTQTTLSYLIHLFSSSLDLFRLSSSFWYISTQTVKNVHYVFFFQLFLSFSPLWKKHTRPVQGQDCAYLLHLVSHQRTAFHSFARNQHLYFVLLLDAQPIKRITLGTFLLCIMSWTTLQLTHLSQYCPAWHLYLLIKWCSTEHLGVISKYVLYALVIDASMINTAEVCFLSAEYKSHEI